MRCSRCKNDLPETEFYWKNKSKGTRSSNCKSCKVLYNKEHYLMYTEKYKTKAKRNSLALRTKFKVLKANLKCSQCGEDHPATLDFHHESDKEFTISYMVKSGLAWDRIEQELAKCIVLCANCHRKHHYDARSSNGRIQNSEF